MTATEILKIREIMGDNTDYFVGVAENIAQNVNKAITSVEVSKNSEFRDVFFHSKVVTSCYELSPQFFKA